MKAKNFLTLVFSVTISELAGVVGSFFTTPNIPFWYAGLIKPSWNPPSWVFAPVWTLLFALMGIAFYLIWNSDFDDKKDRKILFLIYAAQLTLNVFWSILFFGLRNPGAAFIEIIVLWFAILATVIAFWKKKVLAGVLLIPYLLWVSFALALNFVIWQLNK